MKAIAALRVALGMTQCEFANAIGISQAHLSALERGRERVSRDVGLAIFDRYRRRLSRLGYSLEDLLR